MKIHKKIIPIMLICLFLSLSFAPTVNSAEGAEEEKLVGIVCVTEEGADIVYVNLDKEKVKNFENSMNDFIYWAIDNKPLSDLELNNSEKTEIKERLEKILDTLPEEIANVHVDLDKVMELLIPRPNAWFRTRNSLISFGWGHSLIPFYIYEAFIRLAIPFFRPIRILHFAGFTGYIDMIPPEIEYDFERDFHFLTTRCFQGLYIDAGSLITKRFVGGPIILVGRAHVSTLGFWR
jgi:hypothetical protein